MIPLIVFIIFLLTICIYSKFILNKYKNNINYKETFSNYENSIKYSYLEIYDKFYSSIYDKLFNSQIKNEYEILNIKKYTLDKYKKKINILDVGCGTGQHVKILKRYKFNSIGLDNSQAMLEKAKLVNPKNKFIHGDFHDKKLFVKYKFSHIICLFFTIYYSNNPKLVFKNFNYWIKPKGYICIHLVNPKKFDPILEKSSSLIPFFNPQKHSHDRKTETKLFFNNFKYKSNWNFNHKKVTFIEDIKFKNNKTKLRNIHQFQMHNVNKYIKIALKCGFKLVKVIDLTPVNHEFNNIYIFKKIYNLKFN